MISITTLAWFISPHGYGHAARSCAVMNALLRQTNALHFHIFTRVPQWFFEQSLPAGSFSCHSVQTDVGLVQQSPLKADLDQTLKELSTLIPPNPNTIHLLSALLEDLQCRFIVSDISPLAFECSALSGLPCVLLENFTWDWIYKAISQKDGLFKPFADYLEKLYQQADLHIQARPVCNPNNRSKIVNPISRSARKSRKQLRRELGLSEQDRVVLISMGGIPVRFPFCEQLKKHPDITFILPNDVDKSSKSDNLIVLPHHSAYYHPDLVRAADLVVSKVGYSTLAEVYAAGLPLAYVPRPDFRESAVLEAFIQQEIDSVAIDPSRYDTADWISDIQNLFQAGRKRRRAVNGADQAARIISAAYEL